MKFIFFFLVITFPCIIIAQTTTTTSSQGSNNSAGGAYVAPVVTKTYTTPAPARSAPAPAANTTTSTVATTSTNSSSVSYSGGRGRLTGEQKEALAFLKKKNKEDLKNIKKDRKEEAEKFKKFAKENKTSGIPAIVTLEEHFAGDASVYKWPETFQAVIKEGAYELNVPRVNDYYYKVPFPANFEYTAQDDWQLDVSFDVITQSITSWCGIIITSPNKKETDYMVNSSNGLFANNDVSVKKGYNQITLMRRANTFAEYLNKRLIRISTIGKDDITSGKFFLAATKPSSGKPHTIKFDDISFKILAKQ